MDASAVISVSLAYADAVADRVALSRRRLTLCAERSPYAALPPSVKKSQLSEGLCGADRIGEHFRELISRTDEDDAAPF